MRGEIGFNPSCRSFKANGGRFALKGSGHGPVVCLRKYGGLEKTLPTSFNHLQMFLYENTGLMHGRFEPQMDRGASFPLVWTSQGARPQPYSAAVFW
jgi:hypothetical protein